MSDGALQRVQDELRAGLAGEPVDPPADHAYAPGDRPRILNGVVVPARSVADYLAETHAGRGVPSSQLHLYGWRLGQRVPARPEFVRVSQLGPIHIATRAIGSYLPGGGQWLPLYISEDPAELQQALQALLTDIGEWEGRRRR